MNWETTGVYLPEVSRPRPSLTGRVDIYLDVCSTVGPMALVCHQGSIYRLFDESEGGRRDFGQSHPPDYIHSIPFRKVVEG